jgi:hypothetical protein
MIDPNNVTTVRVGELPPADFNLTDKIPHEIGSDLFEGTLQQMADVIGNYLAAAGGVGFRAVTVLDGQTLPATSTQEFILVGKGTFPNVGGGSTIVTTEELNALVSNGTYWSIGVEIPIDAELAGITQNIRSGYTLTTPSENAVFIAIQTIYTAIGALPIILEVPKVQFIADGVQDTFDIGISATIKAVFWNSALLNDNDWSQTGTTFTLTFIPANGDLIKPI